MDAKSGTNQTDKLAELNKKILEVKKKIQLTEGQRKALFEECEAERKANGEQITKLKKEFAQMTVILHENKSPMAKYRLKSKEIEKIVGPLDTKSISDVQGLLDLQIIDKQKQIDLLKYKTKQRKKYLTELATKYEKLLTKQERKELEKKVEQPNKRTTSELQNNIHSMEVKIREAMHVQNRYHDIQRSLKEDSDNFESNIKKLEDELEAQRVDIEKLQKIMDEATRMRNIARHKLLQEEKALNAAAAQREKEAIEGRRLVNERKLELERLERKIFQTGKLPSRPEPEGAEDAVDEKSPPPLHPVETMALQFEILKTATGGTTTEEVLEKFKIQKETEERLNLLRKNSETEKTKFQKKVQALEETLESYKFAEFKDAESKTSEIDNLKEQIEETLQRANSYREERAKREETLKILLEDLQKLHQCINPLGEPQENAILTLQKIESDLMEIFRRIREAEEISAEEKFINIDLHDDKWMPAPYSGLIRRSPIPQPGASPAPPAGPGSEDEEEVPSRGYLKRQAQLVIDAKSRRKNVRMVAKRT